LLQSLALTTNPRAFLKTPDSDFCKNNRRVYPGGKGWGFKPAFTFVLVFMAFSFSFNLFVLASVSPWRVADLFADANCLCYNLAMRSPAFTLVLVFMALLLS